MDLKQVYLVRPEEGDGLVARGRPAHAALEDREDLPQPQVGLVGHHHRARVGVHNGNLVLDALLRIRSLNSRNLLLHYFRKEHQLLTTILKLD